MKANDGLQNIVAGLGTERDKRSYSYYGQPVTLTRTDLEDMYRGAWLPKKIVNAVADDMTREWIDLSFDGMDGESNQQRMESIEKFHSIRTKVNEVLRWARLYGGALLVLGINGDDLSTPLDIESVTKGSLKWVRVLDRHRVSPVGSLVTDIDDPNFGLPDKYTISDTSINIHYSRCIRFDGQKLPYHAWVANGLWDDSELQHVIDSLRNCDTSTASIATMMFEANIDIVSVPDLSMLLATRDGEQKVIKRFQLSALMKSFNRTLLLDGNEKYDKKSNNFTNLDKVARLFMNDVSGAADIPLTRLFGSSPDGLNSTGDSDIRNYYDMLASKQESDLRKPLEFLYDIMYRSEFGSPPKDLKISFKPLWQMSSVDQATVDKTNAERDEIYLANGVITEDLIAMELKEKGVYKNMTNEDIEMVSELSKPLTKPKLGTESTSGQSTESLPSKPTTEE